MQHVEQIGLHARRDIEQHERGRLSVRVPPLAQLQLAFGTLAILPCLAFSRAMQARLVLAAIPGWRGLASRLLGGWCAALVMLLATAPGVVFVDARGGLLAIAIVVAVQHVGQTWLAGSARAFRATWLVASLAGITPAIANTVFAIAFA